VVERFDMHRCLKLLQKFLMNNRCSVSVLTTYIQLNYSFNSLFVQLLSFGISDRLCSIVTVTCALTNHIHSFKQYTDHL